MKFLDSCHFKQVDKVVIKDLCTNDAFIDMDPAAMQVRADAIILPYIREAQESSHQRFTVSEMMVKERVNTSNIMVGHKYKLKLNVVSTSVEQETFNFC